MFDSGTSPYFEPLVIAARSRSSSTSSPMSSSTSVIQLVAGFLCERICLQGAPMLGFAVQC